MKITARYHIEIMGQIGYEGEYRIECDSLEAAEKKIKSMRKSEAHVHLIKTIKEKGKEIQYIVD
jgi:hypothetical protein